MKNLLLISLVSLSAFAQAQQKTITGFTETSASKQLTTEKQFDASLSAGRIEASIKTLSAQPHHLGSPGSKDVAQKI
jgi:N-acetylated-alpha-linked acidic dipeptidase